MLTGIDKLNGVGIVTNDEIRLLYSANSTKFIYLGSVDGWYSIPQSGVRIKKPLSLPTSTLAQKFYAFDDSCDLTITECGWNLEIKDSKRQVFNKFYPGDKPPKVEVACDEECPPGHIKCEHPRYPGYCCIPCKTTAEKINNIANKIR